MLRQPQSLSENGGARVPGGATPGLREEPLEGSRGLFDISRRRTCPDVRGGQSRSGWDDYEAAAVVRPGTDEEIPQAIVRITNERHAGLWVWALGRNNGYGGSSPRYAAPSCSRRMNRVLEINEATRSRPGSHLFNLYDAIRRRATHLSIADLGWGERRREHARPRHHLPAVRSGSGCGGVRLPGGELIEPGTGYPGGACLQARPDDAPDPLFMQSNFGIVTKMGVWLLPTPDRCVRAGWVWKDDDVAGRRDAG